MAQRAAIGNPARKLLQSKLTHHPKTLMVRADVRPDISERVLGHAIPGVEGVYDRHSYLDEKREALEKLAAMVERILHLTPANVVRIDGRPQGVRA